MRGVLGCFIQFMGGLGILLTFVLGYWANWWQLAASISSLVLPFALGMIAVPESPHWCLAMGEYSLFTVTMTPPLTLHQEWTRRLTRRWSGCTAPM